jgi:hypothetical protein
VATTILTPVDLIGSFTTALNGVLRQAANEGPLTTDIVTGATVVLRHADLDDLAHDPRLIGICVSLFDMIGYRRRTATRVVGQVDVHNRG